MSKKPDLTLREIVSRNIKALRLEAELTQSELAERCGFKKQYVSRLESSPQNINLDVLEKVSTALECGVNDLVSESAKVPTSVDGIATHIQEAIRHLEIIEAKIGLRH